jgi:hypothetical protein
MTRASAAVPAGTRAHTVEVRDHAGELVGRVPWSRADELIAAGLVSPIGRNGIKYLVLNSDEPLLQHPWRGGSRTTERMRNQWGVIIGAPKSGLQHRELPKPE